MTARPRQTAGNNPDLARVKRLFNAMIYRETREAYNRGGRDEARAYVGQFFNDEARAERLAKLFPDA